ncbi:hypothetical protein ACFHW2_12080 [Actinomadura sp. LOL_016]|uniref:hypothetical protein n=1 Tax=unclassified Actinomadura TaxID=2626254 RepID=UPI003A7FC9FF
MGTSTNALLIYGYNLGGGELDWFVAEEAGQYGQLNTDWWGEDDDRDFGTAATRRLLDASGFTETYEDGREGYFSREREAEERLGVKVKSYSSGDYPIYTLAAHVITVHRGECDLLDLGDLARRPGENGWDAKLAAALRALGLTPTQAEPSWLLCSYWG